MGDTLSYASSDDWVRVTLADSGVTEPSRGHARGDEVENFENVTGSAYDDELAGNNAANVLMGLAGDDELTGAEGDDTVEGGAGADELDGDNGNEADQTRDGVGAADVWTVTMAMSMVRRAVRLMSPVLCRFGRRCHGEPGDWLSR
jgi:Ca2+-binding RTX toxin-like protein